MIPGSSPRNIQSVSSDSGNARGRRTYSRWPTPKVASKTAISNSSAAQGVIDGNTHKRSRRLPTICPAILHCRQSSLLTLTGDSLDLAHSAQCTRQADYGPMGLHGGEAVVRRKGLEGRRDAASKKRGVHGSGRREVATNHCLPQLVHSRADGLGLCRIMGSRL